MSKHDRVVTSVYKTLSARAKLRHEDDTNAKLVDVYSEIRGQGHATQLLTSIMEDVDRKGITLWLEVQGYGDPHTVLTNSQLIRFYERFGFDVIDHTHCPIQMVRYPLLKGE